MIRKLYLKNFRGIERQEIELGKISIFTGPNNSGKSTLIYGLLTLKNIIINPNQSLDSFLNLGFLSLGGFSQTVYFKEENRQITVGIECETGEVTSEYSATFGKKTSTLSLKAHRPVEVSIDLDVSFPYPANASTGVEVATDYGKFSIAWNGITPTINAEAVDAEMLSKQKDLLQEVSLSLTNPLEELRSVDFIPLRRGFTKPTYSSVPLQSQLMSDDELSTLLATDRDLEGRVAFYLEKILDRTFSVRPTIGTANFALQSRDRTTGFVSDLVNEGFGTNQLVTILTKALRKEVSTICIEEIEIHLHPELMDRVVGVLIDIAMDENKQFIISTHSEHIVSSALNYISKRKLMPADFKLYYLHKDKKRAIVEEQQVNEKGQVAGGLKSFYDTDLHNIRDFFNISTDKE
jgi:predicted ATPase